jgi:phosphinothricin acetyltransferase
MAVLIRLAVEKDAAAIASVYRLYVEDSRVSFEEVAPDEGEMARRIRGDVPGLHPWFVAEENGKLCGFASSAPFRSRPAYRWTVETGIYLIPDACGRGIGGELLSTLLGVLERQGFVSAIGAIALPNAVSVILHERLGYTYAGTYHRVGFKMGEWLDVGLWQRNLAPREKSPVEPRPFSEVTV